MGESVGLIIGDVADAIGQRTPYTLAWSAVGSVLGSSVGLLINTPILSTTTAGTLGATFFGALAVLGVFSRYKDEKHRQYASAIQDYNRMFAGGIIDENDFTQLKDAAKVKYLR